MRRYLLARLTRYVSVVLLIMTGLTVLAMAPPAAAGFCDTNTPTPAGPDTGFAGVFIDASSVEGAPPDGFLANTGVGGFNSFTWDNGCDPLERANVWQNKETANIFTGTAVSITAMTDAVQRWTFSDWLDDVFGGFADRIVDVLKGSMWVVITGLALIIATVVLLARSRHGDLQGVAKSVGWVFIVIMVVGVVFTAPIYIAQQSQQMAGGIVGELQGSPTNPAGGQTEQVMESVHYNSWLRRTFGSEATAVAEQYGPAIFDSVTYTWEEQQLAESDPAIADALIEAHADQFRDAAEAVCDTDPSACRYLHGKENRTGLAAMELGFSAVANGFRAVVSLLLVVAAILLIILGFVWVVGAGYLLNPRGESAGRTMINRSFTAIGYVLIAAVGSYGFGEWSKVALAPGQSSWFSAILLVVGTIIFWGLIRPDRKLLSLATNGKVTGYGKAGGFLMDKLSNFVITKHATEAALESRDQEAAQAAAQAPAAVEATATASPTQPVVFHDSTMYQGPGRVRPEIGYVHQGAVVGTPVGISSEPYRGEVPREGPVIIQGEVVHDVRDDPSTYRRPASESPTPPSPRDMIVYTVDADDVYRRTEAS